MLRITARRFAGTGHARKPKLVFLAGNAASGVAGRAQWTHTAHLSVGTWYALELPADEALAAMRTGIIRLNETHGTANTDTSGYHETLTRFYMTVLGRFAAAHGGPSRAEIVRVLLASPIADRGHPLRFYTRERLMSVAARRGWVKPDLLPL